MIFQGNSLLKLFYTGIFIILGKMIFAQAHLGETIYGLNHRYPNEELKLEYMTDGVPYTTISHEMGMYFYFFNSNMKTKSCMQIPHSIQDLNAQVEIYNSKYVILSENKWKAYLEGGGIMNITLHYDEDLETYLFLYNY
jgi:hypothetical protein